MDCGTLRLLFLSGCCMFHNSYNRSEQNRTKSIGIPKVNKITFDPSKMNFAQPLTQLTFFGNADTLTNQ